ncbi:MAG: hypothetical protein O3C43_06745 [Verrucomicrobia bacterium]|nr:hypothetical protein [Verrucomicrobiota bacterium]MDA1066185.1 hypothetical protein [Verrucomicrobiota bacterium]
MIEHTDILIGLAQVAGVFVGFGTLIIFWKNEGTTTQEVGLLRNAVTVGLIVLIASIIPLLLSTFHLSNRLIWGLSSTLFFGCIWFGLLHPQTRNDIRALFKLGSFGNILFWIVMEVPIQVSLLLVMFGVFPKLWPAFYLTALIVNTFQCAQMLVQLVYLKISTQIR